MLAQPVSPVAAVYVNSGQHVIRGRLAPFRSGRWGKPHTQALLVGAPGLSVGSEAPLSYGSGHHLGSVDVWLLLPSSTRSPGVSCGRYPPSTGRDWLLATSTRGVYAALAGGFVPKVLRGGLLFEKLGGGNRIGRLISAGSAGGSLAAGDALRRPSAIGNAKLRLPLREGAPRFGVGAG